MSLANWTDQQIITQLETGQKWSGSTITYSFPTSASGLYSGNGQASGFTPLTAAGQEKATLALALCDDLIAPDMVKVAAGATYTASNIEYGMSTKGVSYGYSYYPSAGSVWLNSAYNSGGNNLVSPEVGRHGFMTYIHETGHALGLDHMDSGTGPSCYQDSTVYSIMSYYGPNMGNTSSAGYGQVAWGDWVASDGILHAPQTPMLNDIKAIQAIYGVETTTRTGNTVYGFNSNVTDASKAVFDFSVNKHPILCIFDSAGFDTLDLSGFATNSTINLAPGSFSNCDSMTNNISIASNTGIEAAIGGSGSDTITGNNLGNTLNGMAGSDKLQGGAGSDILIGGTGTDTLNGGSGNDVFRFAAPTDGGDIITDFSAVSGNDDVFQIKASAFGGGLIANTLLAAGQLQISASDVAATSAVRFIFETDTGILRYDDDGSGSHAAVVLATLQAGATVNLNDFQFY